MKISISIILSSMTGSQKQSLRFNLITNYEYQTKRYYFYMSLQTFHLKLTLRSRVPNTFSLVSLCQIHYWAPNNPQFLFKCMQKQVKIILSAVTDQQAWWVQLICNLSNLLWQYTVSLYGQNMCKRGTNWFVFIFVLCTVPSSWFFKIHTANRNKMQKNKISPCNIYIVQHDTQCGLNE